MVRAAADDPRDLARILVDAAGHSRRPPPAGRARDPTAGRRDPRGPTDRRIVPGPIPAPASSSSESWRWVVRRRLDHEAARVADVREVAPQRERVDEARPGLAAAREVEREHGARAAREVPRGERLARGVAHGSDLGPRREERRRRRARSRRGARMRRLSVSMPCRKRKALNGLSAAPRSRSVSARSFIRKPYTPNVSWNARPW